jgi:hypothetical protein
VSLLDDDGGRSSDFTVNDGEQKLWIGVRPAWYGNTQGKSPVIQVMYQPDLNSPLQGPVFIDERTWDELARAVKWRRRTYRHMAKQLVRWWVCADVILVLFCIGLAVTLTPWFLVSALIFAMHAGWLVRAE